MTSPRLVKGGIVQVDPANGSTLRVIALQYNPDSLSRTLQVQSSGGDGADKSQALRLKGAAVETLKVEAEIDATDRLEFPDQNAVDAGVRHPPADRGPRAAGAADLGVPPGERRPRRSGVLEVLPLQAPLTLFVWGKNRIVPVRVTDLSITEEAFDVNLNPIRAKVSLGLRVLSVDDLGFDHRGGTLFMGYLRSREAMAASGGSAALSTLGIGGSLMAPDPLQALLGAGVVPSVSFPPTSPLRDGRHRDVRPAPRHRRGAGPGGVPPTPVGAAPGAVLAALRVLLRRGRPPRPRRRDAPRRRRAVVAARRRQRSHRPARH